MKGFNLIAGVVLVAGLAYAAEEPVDQFMGDWQGKVRSAGSGSRVVVAQVVPQGNGTYFANILPEFDKRVKLLAIMEGVASNGTLVLVQKGAAGSPSWTGTIKAGKFTGNSPEGRDFAFSMKKVERISPTMGARPPRGATVLLGRKTKELATGWQREKGGECAWKVLPGGVMQVLPRSGSIFSRKEFGNQRIHLEFRTPYEPDKRGQERGNSGVYVMGRYEVQVLDSYGLEGAHNECGGIYSVTAPAVNMAAPPLQWQTYDITFQAPVLDGGKVSKMPRITVVHNGVKIHDNVELTRATTAAPTGDFKAAGPLYLQDHSHPVEYRNIWIEELPSP